MTFTMNDDRPGYWAAIFFLSDSSTNILAIDVVEQLPRDHPQCVARAATRRAELVTQMQAVQTNILTATAAGSFWMPANTSIAHSSLLLSSTPLSASSLSTTQPCISGVYSALDSTCVCPAGRWGPLCEQGCGGGVVDLGREGWFGGEFATTMFGLPPKYINYADCQWLIRVPQPAKKMQIRVPLLLSETPDYITISAGDSEDVSTYTPVTKLSGLYLAGTTAFTLNSTYALVRFTTDFAHATEPWNQFAGARVSFLGVGCPPGRFLTSGQTIIDPTPLGLAKVWRCEECRPGEVSKEEDATECTPCEEMTYSPTSGQASCLPVSRGYFQLAKGSTEQLSCADYDWPAACESSPYPHGNSQIAVLVFLALGLVILAIATGVIIWYRTERVLFHASPQFIVGVMAGLMLFLVGLILHAIPQTTALCNAKLFPLYLAAPLAFGSLFVRSYRLHRIFHSKTLMMVKLPLWKLWGAVGAMAAVNLVTLCVLVGIAPFTVELSEFPECTSTSNDGRTARGMLMGLIGFNALLLLSVAALAFKLRFIADAYNDTKTMLAASGNIAVVLILLLVFTYSSVGESASTGAVTQLQLALGLYIALTTFFFLFGSKLHALFRSLFTGSQTLSGESSGTAGGTHTKLDNSLNVSTNPSMSPHQKSTNLGGASFVPSKSANGRGVTARSAGGAALSMNTSGSPAPGKRSSLPGASPLSQARVGAPGKAWTAFIADGTGSTGGTGSRRESGQLKSAGNSRKSSGEGLPMEMTSNGGASPSAVAQETLSPSSFPLSLGDRDGGAAVSPVDVSPEGGGGGGGTLLLASPSGTGRTFIPVTDVPGTPLEASVERAAGGGAGIDSPAAVYVAEAGATPGSGADDGARPDWNIRVNSIPLPGGGNTAAPAATTATAAAGGDKPKVGRGGLTIRSGAPVVATPDTTGGSSLRQRWQAARAEMAALQTSVSRMKLELEKQEKLLARANNKTMTLAFEIENGDM